MDPRQCNQLCVVYPDTRPENPRDYGKYDGILWRNSRYIADESPGKKIKSALLTCLESYESQRLRLRIERMWDRIEEDGLQHEPHGAWVQLLRLAGFVVLELYQGNDGGMHEVSGKQSSYHQFADWADPVEMIACLPPDRAIWDERNSCYVHPKNKRFLTAKRKERAIQQLHAEVAEYSAWLTGDVYGFRLIALDVVKMWADGERRVVVARCLVGQRRRAELAHRSCLST